MRHLFVTLSQNIHISFVSQNISLHLPPLEVPKLHVGQLWAKTGVHVPKRNHTRSLASKQLSVMLYTKVASITLSLIPHALSRLIFPHNPH